MRQHACSACQSPSLRQGVFAAVIVIWRINNVCQCDIYAGGRTIQTTAVTFTPYSILYTAQDAMGNRAMPVVRTVSVYDPCSPERYCPSTGMQVPMINLHIQDGHMPFCCLDCAVCDDAGAACFCINECGWLANWVSPVEATGQDCHWIDLKS